MTTTAEATAIEESTQIPHYLAQRLMPAPGMIPRLKSVDIYGRTIPYNGVAGGDLLSWVNFADRYDIDARVNAVQSRPTHGQKEDILKNLNRLRRKGGILLADVAGHSTIDTVQAMMLYQAFHTGALYEIDEHGEITTKLFEQINTRFCRSTTLRNLAADKDASKFTTMIYGEIAESGRFRFVSAGHPEPLIFSNEYNRFMDIDEKRKVSYAPIGLQVTEDHPDRKRYRTLGQYKKKYTVNELNILGKGDILLMYTDGLLDICDQRYSKAMLEEAVSRGKGLKAQDLCDSLIDDRRRRAPVTDDLSIAVIKHCGH